MKKLKNILNEVLAEASVNEVKAKIEILTAMVDGKDMYSIYVDGNRIRVPAKEWKKFKRMVKLQEGKRIKPHDLGYRMNLRRARAEFNRGESIAATSKSGKGTFKIDNIGDFPK